jgi:hypothetical protein
MTILEDGIFSLTDFQTSDAEIVFLPEIDGVRTPEVWHRGDYQLLSSIELTNQMELFLSAREMAYPLLREWVASKEKGGASTLRIPIQDDPQPRLDFRPFPGE